MSKYLDWQTDWFRWLEKRVANTENPRHKAILQNYLHHAALELSGQWPQIFETGMTAPEPVYHIYGLGYEKLTTFSGHAEVIGFYNRLNEGTVALVHPYGPIEYCLEATDWGFFTFMSVVSLLDGEQLQVMGLEVDDPGARYAVEMPTGNRWWYDDQARLAGEDVYQITETTISKLDPADDVTLEELHASARPWTPGS